MSRTRVFIDGSAGTTGLRIRERLAARDDLELLALPEERRTEESAYRARLAACRACGHLAEGTCGLCGCYVEYRAAQAHKHCPNVPGRW